ncbi:unnamed protein product, partial [Mesorhabditis belari]|uniref:Uncharacterized protein n=1 Tax=Mesorhabditis belari TaxID=2138241 RepID=A0AAF3FIX4_9BILA
MDIEKRNSLLTEGSALPCTWRGDAGEGKREGEQTQIDPPAQTTPFLSFVSTFDRLTTTTVSSDYQMIDDSTSGGAWNEGNSSNDSHNKMPAGALTVLVIAAVAITSVIVTLVCMLANSRRTRRTQTRIQQSTCQSQNPSTVLQAPTVVVVDRVSNLPPPLPPIYTRDTQGPKYFDAPPSYDEAVNTPIHSPITPSPRDQIPDTTPSTVTSVQDTNSLRPRARLENGPTEIHMTEIELS